MTHVPTELRYHPAHLWARPRGDRLIRVGISDFAQQALGDVVAMTLPDPGDTVIAGAACGDIESTKSVSDLVCPVSGTVRAVNETLRDAPELVNTGPYDDGWLFEVEIDPAGGPDELAALMSGEAYRDLVGA